MPSNLRPNRAAAIASGRFNPRPIPAIAAAFLLAACASSQATTPIASPEQTARVRHACAITMGLNPSEEDFDMCRLSLLQTLSRVDQARAIEAARAACNAQGLKGGTPAFAQCVQDANPARRAD
jgi:hypothetical protein